MPKHNGSRGRAVIITQGADPTIVAHNGWVREVAVSKIPKEKIIDTNGAGDAFVGGFLVGLLMGKPLESCCRLGNYAAGTIIQRSGVTLPALPEGLTFIS